MRLSLRLHRVSFLRINFNFLVFFIVASRLCSSRDRESGIKGYRIRGSAPWVWRVRVSAKRETSREISEISWRRRNLLTGGTI
jgi:hypothetical protein